MMLSATAKKQLVQDAMNGILFQHDEEATHKAFSPNFIQHNPMSQDGIEHLVDMTKFAFVWEHARWIVDGDIVVYHGMYSSNNPLAPDSPLLCVDMWRLDKDSRVVEEHWDALEVRSMPVLANMIAGNGDGLLEGTDVKTNKKVVTDFMRAYNVGDTATMKQFVAEYFCSHSPDGPVGIEQFGKETHEIKRVVASGDLVLVHSKYVDTEKAAFDWFRVTSDQRIAEHWRVAQDIMKETKNPHPHF